MSRLIDNEETGGVEIKITREPIEHHDRIDQDYDRETPPFPQVDNNTSLKRTSLVDLSSPRDNWRNVKEKTVGEPADNNHSKKGGMKKLLSMIKATPQNTKNFLGIESVSNSNSLVAKGRDATDNSVTASPHYNKTLTNWEERTFRVLNTNPIFGGKVKESNIEKYLDRLDDTNVDITDPFLYYKLNGSSLDLSKNKQKITIKKMANNGFRRVFKKSDDTKKETDTTHVDEEPFLSPQTPTPFSAIQPLVDESDAPPQPRVLFRQPVELPADEQDEEENIAGPCDAFTHAFTGKRVFGVGFCGRLFDNFLDPSKKHKYEDLLKSIKQHRPYFTYWITFVQIVVCLVSIFAYGLAPIGFSYSVKRGLATTINLEKQLISYPIKQNFWIGPAAMDLVHLGAKYAPCMRNDTNIYKAIELDRMKERESACCIRYDKGGCVQANQEKCSNLLSHWYKWNETTYEPNSNFNITRSSGSVCGLDPE